jgi:hypothetical protein
MLCIVVFLAHWLAYRCRSANSASCNINPVLCNKWTNVQKCKFVPVHAVKAYREIGGIAPPVLNLDTWWTWVVSLTSRPLYPWEGTMEPIEYEAVLAPVPMWMFWRRANLLHLLLFDTQTYQAIAWSLYRLRQHGSNASKTYESLGFVAVKNLDYPLGYDTAWTGRWIPSFLRHLVSSSWG